MTEKLKEEQNEIISSFGMFWKRDKVDWRRTPKLLGKQRKDIDSDSTKPVDFCKQRGVYLLYDGREVIYVGRITDRPLGRRMYKHHSGRLAGRWDRFSWFGLCPVEENNDGELKVIETSSDSLEHDARGYSTTKLIQAFEAILIESIEPRQNRKKGDYLRKVEYLQWVDSNSTKEKVDEALKRLTDLLK